MGAYYNEIEPFAAQWLRNLIRNGIIAGGDVDERSITEIDADDLRGYDQCHFFAGIGVWSYALRQAGWDDKRKIWTGSCPCQPFSVAGKGGGFDDERHLWPVWFRLIAECRPDVVIGEQVANSDALAWFDTVQTDLEAQGYAVGAADICAAGLGSPQLRQRLWWVANAARHGRREECPISGGITAGNQKEGRTPRPLPERNARALGDSMRPGPQIGPGDTIRRRVVRIKGPAAAEAGVVSGFWGDADLVWHRDGKYRPVEPGAFPLAHGVTNRVGRLRATGNALCAPVAEAFVRAYMDISTGSV